MGILDYFFKSEEEKELEKLDKLLDNIFGKDND